MVEVVDVVGGCCRAPIGCFWGRETHVSTTGLRGSHRQRTGAHGGPLAEVGWGIGSLRRCPWQSGQMRSSRRRSFARKVHSMSPRMASFSSSVGMPRGGGSGEQCSGLFEVRCGVAGDVQSEVPDLPEALGEYVEEESSDELGAIEPQEALACTECDLAVGDGDDAVVGDGDAVDVAGEVLECVCDGSVGGWLDVDDPSSVSLADES